MFSKKDKGKGLASSSSNPKSKKARLANEAAREDIPKPDWKRNELLCDKHEVWQEDLYFDKMNTLKHPDNALQCEKAIVLSDFRPLGVVECFEKLGWEEALSFYDQAGNNKIPVRAIYEWMSTLKRVDGNNPPKTTQLIGQIGGDYGHEMVMSFSTIKRVVNFDSKPENEYTYPSDRDIYKQQLGNEEGAILRDTLFVAGATELVRRDLNILPKLCATIMGFNILPRSSDKAKVRLYELRVLGALVTDSEKLSLRHLIINNIWESRNSKERCVIPHCRLITALLRKQKIINEHTIVTSKPHRFFSLASLDKETWNYRLTARHHILTDIRTGQTLQGVREDVPEGLDEEMEEGEDAEENVDRRESGRQQIHGGWKEGAYDRLMARRPPNFKTWDQSSQCIWDQGFLNNEMNMKRMNDFQTSMHWAQQQEINDRHIDAENRRRYDDWCHGRVFQANPAPIQWDTLPPYQGGDIPFSYPRSHSSRWVPLPSPQPPPSETSGSGSSQAFNMHGMSNEVEDIFRGIFGAPVEHPPYDQHYYPGDYRPPG